MDDLRQAHPAPVPLEMLAWRASAYGGPEVLKLGRVATPLPRDAEILIRVQATTVSSADRRIRAMDFPSGLAVFGRAYFGWRTPRRPILGCEATGVVVEVGAKARRFQPGDAVIAFPSARGGGHGEYLRMPESGTVVARPAGMSIEAAAALAFGGLTARDFLRRSALKAGERLLVIGACGTVGSALLQLGAASGALVHAVTSTANTDLARALGAAAVIDYTRQDVLDALGDYDLIADAVGALRFAQAWPRMRRGARFLAINGSVGDMLSSARQGRACVAGPSAERVEDLHALVALHAAGDYVPLIDRVFDFADMPAAHARVDSGRKRGSVVVRVG